MKTLTHKFVEFIPENIEYGIIYISLQYKSVVHSCVCGCGNRVITPLSPADWKLTFDGISISLYPSIGNWNFNCKSHYWITNNKVTYATRWNNEEIDFGRYKDKKKKKKFYRNKKLLRFLNFQF